MSGGGRLTSHEGVGLTLGSLRQAPTAGPIMSNALRASLRRPPRHPAIVILPDNDGSGCPSTTETKRIGIGHLGSMKAFSESDWIPRAHNDSV